MLGDAERHGVSDPRDHAHGGPAPREQVCAGIFWHAEAERETLCVRACVRVCVRACVRVFVSCQRTHAELCTLSARSEREDDARSRASCWRQGNGVRVANALGINAPGTGCVRLRETDRQRASERARVCACMCTPMQGGCLLWFCAGGYAFVLRNASRRCV